MTLYELAQICNKGVDLHWVHDAHLNPVPGTPWHAHIEGAWTLDGDYIGGEFGAGDTPEEALEDYVKNIQGKTLVFEPRSKERRKEISVPTTLSLGTEK